MLGTRTAAEDALQDVFIRIWRQAGQFARVKGRAMAWIVAIARNRAIDLQRAGRPSVLLEAAELAGAGKCGSRTCSSMPSSARHAEALRRCLEILGTAAAVSAARLSARSYARADRAFDRPTARNGQELDATGSAEPPGLHGIMNYNRPELLDRLAAEYVLGLLRHRARARFERLCAELPSRAHRPAALGRAPAAPESGAGSGGT